MNITADNQQLQAVVGSSCYCRFYCGSSQYI